MGSMNALLSERTFWKLVSAPCLRVAFMFLKLPRTLSGWTTARGVQSWSTTWPALFLECPAPFHVRRSMIPRKKLYLQSALRSALLLAMLWLFLIPNILSIICTTFSKGLPSNKKKCAMFLTILLLVFAMIGRLPGHATLLLHFPTPSSHNLYLGFAVKRNASILSSLGSMTGLTLLKRDWIVLSVFWPNYPTN